MPKLLKAFYPIPVFLILLFNSTTIAFAAPECESNQTGLGFGNECSASDLVNNIVNIAIGASGGVAFLLLVYGGFRMVASQGDPKALQEARGIIMSAISGLLFIVFSVFILKLIGFTVLGVF